MKTHIEDLPEGTEKNLKELAAYLRKFTVLPKVPLFDMTSFYNPQYEEDDVGVCATAACAVGHYAIMRGWDASENGAKPKNPSKEYLAEYTGMHGDLKRMSWCDFCTEEIGVEAISDDTSVFDWLFGSDWDEVDNTPTGAAKRIDYFLEFGVPEKFIDLGGDSKACEAYKETLEKYTPTVGEAK